MSDLEETLKSALVTALLNDAELKAALVEGVIAELHLGDNDWADGYLNVKQAAEFLNCSTSRVYKLAESGELPHTKDNARLRFVRSQLRQFLDNGGAALPAPLRIAK